MNQDVGPLDTVRMWALLVPVAAYLWWIDIVPAFSGHALLDGSIGVVR